MGVGAPFQTPLIYVKHRNGVGVGGVSKPRGGGRKSQKVGGREGAGGEGGGRVAMTQ